MLETDRLKGTREETDEGRQGGIYRADQHLKQR